MPVIIFVLIVALIATYGFWDTFQAILGAVGILILLAVLGAGLVATLFTWGVRRFRRKIGGR